MEIGYIAVERYFPCEDFKKITGYHHLEEVITIDHQVCSSCIQKYSSEDLLYIYKVDDFTDFDIFTNLDILLKKFTNMNNKQVLALIREPEVDCRNITINNFSFIGYDLIEEDTRRSILSNCFDNYHSYVKDYISKYGLIEDYQTAKNIQKIISKDNEIKNVKVWGIYRFNNVNNYYLRSEV